MQILFTVFSNTSGKSFILQIEEKKYVFNLFEGFQLYSIEKKFSIGSIDFIFMAEKANVIPFIGICPTLSAFYYTEMNIVSSFDLDFYEIHKFTVIPYFKLIFF